MEMSRYVDLFLAESRERLDAAQEIVARLPGSTSASGLTRELLRHAHSLKGMAASMGYRPMVELSHALEDLLEHLGRGGAVELQQHLPLLKECLSCLGRMVDGAEQGREIHEPHAQELVDALRELQPAVGLVPGPSSLASPEAAGATRTHGGGEGTPVAATVWRIELALAVGVERPAERTVSILGRLARLGRLRSADPPLLDPASGCFEGRLRLALESVRPGHEIEHELRSLPEVGEFSVTEEPPVAHEPAAPLPPLRWIRVRADRLDTLVERVLELRLELDRLRALVAGRDPIRQHLHGSEFLVKEIYNDLIELRLVPFESVAHRLHQCVRELAGELGKQVQFEIGGGHVRLDRLVLETLLDPLLHMIRNALDHGLESPPQRTALGKPAAGTLRLQLERLGDRIQIAVEDDGRGLDVGELRRVAVERGLIGTVEAERLGDTEALMLATWPGFSTAPRISRISGRGVGLEVAREGAERLGGLLRIQTTPGAGTRILITVPLSLSLIQALLFRCAGELYALPVAAVRRTGLLTHTEQPTIELLDLAELLALEPTDAPKASPPCVLILAGVERPLGLVIDEIVGRRDIVVHPFQAPLTLLRNYSGAALLEDGTIALVLDPLSL